MTKIMQILKQPHLIKTILFISVIVLFFYSINLNPEMSNMSTESQDMAINFLQGNYGLNGWNISLNEIKITDFIYYLIPVKIWGQTPKAAMLSLFCVLILSVLSAYLLVISNRKEAHINNIMFFVCLLGISPAVLLFIAETGTFIPFLFFSLFFFNKYIKTDKIQYLIIATVSSAFLIFSDMFSLIVLVIPVMLYALIKLFFMEQMKKNLRILLAILFAISSGLFLFTIYTKFNTHTTFLTDTLFYSFYDKEKYHLIYRIYEIVYQILFVQNANFTASPLYSLKIPLLLFKFFITVIGFILSLKIFFSTIFVPKYKADFISFALATGVLAICFFAFSIESGVNEYITPLWSFIPFAIAIIIMRYKRWLNKINPFSYNILLIISCCLTLLSYFPN